MKKQKAKNKIAKLSGKIAYNFHVGLPYTVRLTEEDDHFDYILNHFKDFLTIPIQENFTFVFWVGRITHNKNV